MLVSEVSFFFAGGGTGGHIYPALAVAEQIVQHRPEAHIRFLCSTRAIDKRILDTTPFEYTVFPATGLYFDWRRFLRFCSTFRQTYSMAKEILVKSPKAVVIGAGGFVAAPVCLVGHRLGTPVALVNVDITPGRANKLCARWANEIFVQFTESQNKFSLPPSQVHVLGCPLRSSFTHPDRIVAMKELDLDTTKKVLLVTGASSGSSSINEAICRLLPKLVKFAETWQIVHLTGLDNYEKVSARYENVGIAHRVVSYYDRAADLLAAADLIIGRSGAVSVAEYAVAGIPTICMPYPHHKDRHQYLNAGKLVEVGASVIVDDVPDDEDRAAWLWEELEPLMTDDKRRRDMAEACKQVARPDAAGQIAERLLAMADAV